LNPDIARPLLPERISKNIQYFAGRTWLLPKLMEWLENSDERFFILQGAPGTGKSMIMAWIAGIGAAPMEDEAAADNLQYIRSNVKGIHFCIAGTESTEIRVLAENLAQQLGRSIASFSEAVKSVLPGRYNINASAQLTDVKAETAIGVQINVDLKGLADNEAFNLGIVSPLKELYRRGFDQRIILLVDALDESVSDDERSTIVERLAGLKGDQQFPKQV